MFGGFILDSKGVGHVFFYFLEPLTGGQIFCDTTTDRMKIRLSIDRAFKNDIRKLIKHGLRS